MAARKDSGVWSPLRMLRGNRESLEASETSHRDYEYEMHDKELVDRVMKWLEESKPPRLDRCGSRKESKKNHTNIGTHKAIKMESKLTDSAHDLAPDSILYHPDFADWSCVQYQTEKKQIKSMEDILLVGARVFHL
jgi:hypothetical protein